MSRIMNAPGDRVGRRVVAVIGVDRYRNWPRLSNAVNDARGALRAFVRLGFEQFAEPLLDEAATAEAIQRLITDDLAELENDDSLVLFFAGHGHTTTQTFQEGDSLKTGYIIPVDGDEPRGTASRWVHLDHWLSDVARLAARHILVFLDACHSGIALESLLKWRGFNQPSEALRQLAKRRSRRVITSALDSQQAMDCGPLPNHSLFTGCLIEGLNGGIAQPGEIITGSQIGHYLQRRVASYPQSTQTPDIGALELDDRGEIIVQIAAPSADNRIASSAVWPPLKPHVSSTGPSSIRRRSDPEPWGLRTSSTMTSSLGGIADAENVVIHHHDIRDRADIAVLVALDEEFEQLAKLVKFGKGIADGHGGYYFPFTTPNVHGEYRCIAKLIGEMGISAARGPAARMLDHWTPAVAVMVGIAASLDDGIKLGDVVMATQIDAYDSNSKVVATRRGGIEYQHRGTVFRGDPRLIAAIRDLRFAHEAEFDAFVSACAEECAALLSDAQGKLPATEFLSPRPSVHRVHVASGSVLGSAAGFKRWLRRRDQTLKALEMEGAALAAAAEERQPQVTALVFRGISDFADERKRKLDSIASGGIRRYAMRNAVRFLFLLAELGILPRHSR